MDGMNISLDDFDGFDEDDPQLTQHSIQQLDMQTSNSTMNSMGTNNVVILRCDDQIRSDEPLQ